MPTEPTTGFVLVHPGFTLRFFEGSLNRPTPTGHLRQVTALASERCIAQMKLQLDRSTETPTQNRPSPWAGQRVAHGGDAQESELRPQRTFAAFFNQVSLPGTAWQVGCDLSQFTRDWGIARQARMNTRPAQRTAARLLDRRRAQPDTGVARH